MTRAQRRREAKLKIKEEKKQSRTASRHLKTNVDNWRRDEEMIQQIREEAIGEALMIMLCFPLKVLKDNYWKKTAPQRLRVFTDKVLDMYEDYLNDLVDIDALKEDLWEYGGIKLVRTDEKG